MEKGAAFFLTRKNAAGQNFHLAKDDDMKFKIINDQSIQILNDDGLMH